MDEEIIVTPEQLAEANRIIAIHAQQEFVRQQIANNEAYLKLKTVLESAEYATVYQMLSEALAGSTSNLFNYTTSAITGNMSALADNVARYQVYDPNQPNPAPTPLPMTPMGAPLPTYVPPVEGSTDA
jgi:hypothetical protein